MLLCSQLIGCSYYTGAQHALTKRFVDVIIVEIHNVCIITLAQTLCNKCFVHTAEFQVVQSQ